MVTEIVFMGKMKYLYIAETLLNSFRFPIYATSNIMQFSFHSNRILMMNRIAHGGLVILNIRTVTKSGIVTTVQTSSTVRKRNVRPMSTCAHIRLQNYHTVCRVLISMISISMIAMIIYLVDEYISVMEVIL